MPLTRAARAAANTTTQQPTKGSSKIAAPPAATASKAAAAVPVTRKRSMISPGNHKQCSKRTALGDITNQFVKGDDNAGKKATDKGAAVATAKVPFTIFEEHQDKKPAKPTKCEKASKDLVVANASVTKELSVVAVPSGVSDIDKDSDPAFAAEYAHEIFTILQEREKYFLVSDYLRTQSEITVQMRAILIDWLVEVQETFELFHETLYMAVRMVDRYLDRKSVGKSHLQLLGVTAMFLSSKIEERYPPALDDFIFTCDRAYTEEQILEMERVLLAELEYDINMPLSYSFLRRYGKCVSADMNLLTIGRYALELALQEYKYVTYRESQLAAAALLFSLRKNGSKLAWDSTCVHYTKFEESELEELVAMMDVSTTEAASNTQCTTIYKKYSHQVFFKVALLPPLTKVSGDGEPSPETTETAPSSSS